MPRPRAACAALAALALAWASPAAAADLENARARQEGNRAVLTYDLISDGPAPVSVKASDDGGKTWNVKVEHLTGDVGGNVPPGKGKTIVWEALRDYPRGISIQALVFELTTSGVVVTNGLVAYYPFEQSFADASGSGRNGLRVGSPSFEAGPIGKALRISTGNFVRVPNGFVPGSGNFSISVRYYAPRPAPAPRYYNPHFVTMQGGDFAEGAIFRIVGIGEAVPRLNLVLQPGAYSGGQSVFAPAPLDSWHHAVAVVDRGANRARIYLDGAVIADQVLTITGSIDPAMDMLIGAYDYITARNGAPRFVGGDVMLDDIRIYNRVLTSDEIALLGKR